MNGFYSIKQPWTLLLILLVSLVSLSCSDSSSPKRKAHGQLVKVSHVALSPMQSEQTLSGTLKAIRTVDIFNQEEGIIIDLPVYPGDKVEKDQLIVQLEATLIQAEYNKAQIAYRQAALDFKRLKQLRKKRLTTDEALTSAQTTVELARAEETVLKIRLQRTQIKAPFAGVVSRRLKEPGDVLAKFSSILRIVDISKLKVQVNLPERLLSTIKAGEKFTLFIDALGTQPYTASVSRIYPTIDDVTRQGTLEAILESLPPLAKPGQLARLTLKRQLSPRLHIPFKSIKHNARGSYVYKIINNKAIETKVTTGIQLGSNIEVLTGLKENDKVVTQGFLGLNNKKLISIIAE